jgi:Flp pilus assembly pilin Flp
MFARSTEREHGMNVIIHFSLLLRHFATGKSGAVAVEYAFLAAFIAIVAAVGMVLVGPELQEFFVDTGTAVLGAGSGNFTNDPIPTS